MAVATEGVATRQVLLKQHLHRRQPSTQLLISPLLSPPSIVNNVNEILALLVLARAFLEVGEGSLL